MTIRQCTQSDIALLARMNKHLIEDERAPNAMDIAQLQQRMTQFILGSYCAYFFMVDNAPIGYALCDSARTPMYLRQFFIERAHRRRGYGKVAFQLLLAHLGVEQIDIDVYAWNAGGIAFWQTLGFSTRYHSMRYEKSQPI